MNLIPNWRSSWRMFSMQALAIIAALQGIVLVLPPESLAQPALGMGMTWAELNTSLTIVAAVLGAIGRVIDQSASTNGP